MVHNNFLSKTILKFYSNSQYKDTKNWKGKSRSKDYTASLLSTCFGYNENTVVYVLYAEIFGCTMPCIVVVYIDKYQEVMEILQRLGRHI